MNIYYVYQLIDPRTNKPFYIGKGSGDRAWTHNKFKDGNCNPYKDRYIRKLHRQKLEPIVDIVKYFEVEDEAYQFEEQLTESIGLENLTNMVIGVRPPSQKGRIVSAESRAKRSVKLKGIPRTEEWRKRLSESKSGENNPRYGVKEDPEAKKRRRLAVLKGKNAPNYDLYKQAIALMDNGTSADKVAEHLGIGRNICFKLKNRSHGIFEAFPELVELYTG